MRRFADKKLIVGSVAIGPYANYGNVLIERATFSLLGLPRSTAKFSVFDRIDDELLERINSYDYLLITGCTTLQDHPGHQRCFDEQFRKIKIPKICFGATFYCEPDETPSLRVAQMYDLPIGARDPWCADYLRRNGIDCEFIGCPTALDGPDLDDWQPNDDGDVLISSTPPIDMAEADWPRRRTHRYLAHDLDSPGEPVTADGIFESASLVITGRLHGALPAIARGIPVRFYDQRNWHPDYRLQHYGSNRYSLLEFFGIPLNGGEAQDYPAAQIRALKRDYRIWVNRVLGSPSDLRTHV
jgi:hypothetical protein